MSIAVSDSLMRLPEVLGIIPVSRATWYDGIKTGRFPAQVKIGRISVWRRSDIDRLMASFSHEGGHDGER